MTAILPHWRQKRQKSANPITKKIGYVLLGNTDGRLASTRITVLNTLGKLCDSGYDPIILDKSDSYNPNRELTGIVLKAINQGFGKGDIVYFQSTRGKSAIAAAKEFKALGISSAFGICNFVAPEMAAACDATIVPSQRLKDHYPTDLHDRISVIHDGIEFPDVRKANYSSQQNPYLSAVFLTGKRYNYVPGMFLPDYAHLTVIGPYGLNNLPDFRIPRGYEGKIGVDGIAGPRDFSREIWSLDAYKRIIDFDIGVAPVDIFEPMPRPDQAPTETRSANKLTQMMSAGLPVIAGPLPAYVDIITQGVDGFIARTHDEWLSAFAELQSAEARERIGQAACERVQNEFSLDAQINKLFAVFNSLHV